jgi:simple sugar transport system ATP-binding protein
MVELKGIQKYFPANGVLALDEAAFELRPGEIHALLGENGAGKSTLMHIMAGYLRPDGGSVFAGKKERNFIAPAQALAAGIGMVPQHPHIVPGFTVWENCTLGAETHFFLRPREARKRAAEISERWGFDLPMDAPAESLTVSRRQKAAALALLLKGVRWFIFDEPAAVLSPRETESLFGLFRRLRDEGRGIALISHKLYETLELADRVTVIRRGKTFPAKEASSLSDGELRGLIFGPSAKSAPAGAAARPVKKDRSPAKDPSTAPLLLVRDLKVEIPGMPFVRNISLELRGGKILGVTGIRDSGLETLELALAGFLRPSGKSADSGNSGVSGLIRLNGRDVGGVRSFREAGGAYLGADRLGVNLAPGLPLKESLIIHAGRRSRMGLLGKLGLMDENFLNSWCRKIMRRAGISRSPKSRSDSFSGGMLQRILLARELEENASLLILAEPGWGLDQEGRVRMAEELRACTRFGKGVMLLSTDVDELLSLSDEIAVLFNGTISARFPLESGDDRALSPAEAKVEIGRAMVGEYEKEAGRGL